MDTPINYKRPLIGQTTKAQQKMSLNPIVVPRSHDREVWSYPSYKHSAANDTNGIYDLTAEYIPVDQKEEYQDYDPRLKKYTGFEFKNLEEWCGDKPSHPKQSTPIYNVMSTPSLSASTALSASPALSASRPLKEKFGESIPENSTPLTFPDDSLLIPKDTTDVYAPDETINYDRFKYMENIQGDNYTYADVSYPINSNIGISYTPQNPPLVVDQVAMNDGIYPLYHRIDPQLIRDGGIPEQRLAEIPRRTTWSSKYSGLDAAPGSVNFEDIYDPRFNGYGDPYRSYGDVNAGQIQYYYSDVDAYRYPNFGIRSKVDFIDYVDPMGKVVPEYTRNVGLEDVKKDVHNQYTADSLYFREDLQERLMRKRNAELWQLRAMPLRKNANTHFSSNY